MPIGAALFDLDGTLVDSLPLCYVAFRSAVELSGGAVLSDAEIHALFGPSEDGMMQRVFPDDWHGALGFYFKEYERLLPTCPAMIPDLVTALQRLKTLGIPIGW
jgi:pyrophosphatase PpaX